MLNLNKSKEKNFSHLIPNKLLKQTPNCVEK